jgi:thiol:disulfide interchange protein DsbD
MTRRLLALLTLLLAGLAPVPAQALESAVVASPRAQVSLVSEHDSVQPGQTLRLALRLRMAPGWYTYWRNPGDAGAPAELDFQLPAGLTAGSIAWPTPARHPTGPVMSYGYDGEVLLPVSLTLPATLPAEPLTLQLHASWLVCERICVPEEGGFSLTLPAGPPAPSAEAPLFAATDAATPRAATPSSPWQATISPEAVLSLRLPGLDATQVREAWFAPYAWGQVEHSAPQPLSTAEGGFTLALRPGAEFRHAAGLAGIVVVTDHTGRTTAMELAAEPGPSIVPAATLPLWQLVAFALAAGAILNLMPCVFPVLAMKAIGLAALSGQARAAALAQAGAYTAGVLATFLALAGTLVALRAAGEAVGWGFQFQSPVFVAATAWIMLAIGLNMSGLYAIGGGRVAGLGANAARKGGLAGQFLTGLLAVLVATPCTAPFMGAAIAGALAAPLAVTLLGFLAMGIGFALPYVLFAAIPGIARRLPRPGAWMDILRQALAFPMYGAAVWLLWVVSLQAGPTGVLATAAGMLLVAFALWALGLAQSRPGTVRRLAAASALLAGLGAIAVLTTLATTPAATAAAPSNQPAPDSSQPFTPARLAELRAAGTPVFLNMTAAWCVTCIVNEQVALAQPAIRAAFAKSGVTYLKGDWTRRDPAITDYLRAMGRDGVPLYVLYPGKGAAPVVLPQILTETRVLEELHRAGL